MTNEQLLFQQMRFIRKITLYEIQKLNEQLVNIMPSGFNNTIRWHIGHIYTFQQMLLQQNGGLDLPLDDYYLDLFAPKTSPEYWLSKPPTLDELHVLLELQPTHIEQAAANKLFLPASVPFKSISTIGELLTFSIYHEGLHLGAIKAMKKSIEQFDRERV